MFQVIPTRMEMLWVHPQQLIFSKGQWGIFHTAPVLHRNLQKENKLNVLRVVKLSDQFWVGSGGKQMWPNLMAQGFGASKSARHIRSLHVWRAWFQRAEKTSPPAAAKPDAASQMRLVHGHPSFRCFSNTKKNVPVFSCKHFSLWLTSPHTLLRCH